MAQHGYLGDDYGSEYDPDYDADRDDRRERDQWRGGDDRQRWRDDRGGRDSFMFDDRSGGRSSQGDRYRSQYRDDDRGGFFSRMGDEARSWFSDDEREGARDRGQSRGSDSREWFGGRDRSQDGRPSFSSHPDDHYRSWRDRQMAALDRDYQDYCREREQQFHQDFDSWRNSRQGDRTAGIAAGRDPLNSTAGTTDPASEPRGTADPESNATLGTNNSENTARGRR